MPIYYINLHHRGDRRLEIELELIYHDLIDQATRICAIYIPDCGRLGCTLSHIKALETFLESEKKKEKEKEAASCIVLEDDFQFCTMTHSLTRKAFNYIQSLDLEWDVIMLAANTVKIQEEVLYDSIVRCDGALSSSGYVVKRRYVPTLIKNLKECAMLLNISREYPAMDVHWLPLQSRDNWYILNPCLGSQRAGYSDIEKRYCNYGV